MTQLSTPPTPSTLEALRQALEDSVEGEVMFDAGMLAAYSTDASNFRQVPYGVVQPHTPEDAIAAVAACREHGVPVVSRGGGTSLAGQGTNRALVLDFSRHCNRLVSVDAEARRCVVEPGIVLDDLNRQLRDTGLRFGPEPATHFNCTLGGMIGNNSCGATAQRTGKTVDNVHSLDVVLYDGTRFTVGPTSDAEYAEIERRGDRRAEVYRTLRRLRDEHADEIRARFPDIPRRVSGYNLDSLLPEYGFDLARFLVGSEGTLAFVLRAELDLVEVLPERTLVVLGYPDIFSAAAAVPSVLQHEPVALEGLDDLLIHDQQLQHLNPDALEEMPKGAGFLMVQFASKSKDEAEQQAHHMLDALQGSEHEPRLKFFDDPEKEHELWLVRESGLGATAHVPHHPETFEGWEDSAVDPSVLSDYLRDLRALFVEFGYQSDVGPALYGHFGQGCVHTRIPFDLFTNEGVATYRKFMERAADLVVSYGGSLSGEHGDGQSRGELLPKMFGEQLVAVMERVKALFDPDDRMNPGKVVAPAALDEHLRLGKDWGPIPPEELFFGYPHDDHSFLHAANRCVGVGKCRQLTHEGQTPSVMCPSYQATREERHSTRGRARLLFEMLDGHGDSPLKDRWRSKEVKEALDLCLSCKGCKHDCPAAVDMATYKAEFLAHHYAGRLRPRADYATGWLPMAARAIAATRTARAVNVLSHAPGMRRLGLLAAGLEDREVPLFAPQTLQQWFAGRPHRSGDRGTVLLWPDTFTNHFHPEIGRAAVRVLERAGWTVTMPSEPLCCGLTWISTGQLKTARRVLRRTVEALAPHTRAGGLVLGLEPSCTTVFRADAPEMFPDDLDVLRLRDATVTFAELLTEHNHGWGPPDLSEQDVQAMVQVHCHQHAVLGWDADRKLLEAAGVDATRLESGCCGLAGNFGFTAGHGEVSLACAEQGLLPALRSAPSDTVVLADGFSCRTQIRELHDGPQVARHLAELIDDAETRPGSEAERQPERTPTPPRTARVTATASALVGAAAIAAAALRHLTTGTRTR